MTSPKSAPRAGVAVGRVGALAVALGIGATALVMPALATADTRGAAGSGSADSAGSSTDARGSGGGNAGSAAAGRHGGPGLRTASEGWVPAPAAGVVPAPSEAVPSEAEPMPVEGTVSPEIIAAPPAPAARAPQQTEPEAETGSPATFSRSVRPPQQKFTWHRGPARRSGSAADSATAGTPAPVSVPSTAATAPTRRGGVDTVLPAAGQQALASAVSTGGAGAAAPVMVTLAGSGTAGIGPVTAPAATPAPPGAFAQRQVPEAIQKIDAQIQSQIRTVFSQLINWVSTLPVNDFTTWMQGGLLMLRKSLFNQTASVSAVQTVNTSNLVKGKIDMIDPEGDAYTVELVEEPTQGTVELAPTSQADGRGNTKYTYTPGQGYTGADQFVVKISPAGVDGINVFHPFGVLDTRYYTVKVGSDAVSDTAFGADAKDTLNTALYLANAGVTVTVKKQGWLSPTYDATVTLSAPSAGRSFDWMDSRGRKGRVSVESMLTENWDTYAAKAAENGVKPLLMFKYTDAGIDNVVFLDVAKAIKNTDGTCTFSGQLSADAPAQDGRVDWSDFTGIKYTQAYERFLSSTGLKDSKAGVSTTISKVGTLGTTTLSPSAFVEDGGHDYPSAPSSTPPSAPRDASATQTYPGATGPGTTDVNQGNGSAVNGNTNTSSAQLTAMVPWGSNGSFITATNLATGDDANNGIYLYTVNAPTGGASGSAPTWGTPIELAGSGWNAAVNTMSTWTQVVTDADGNPVPLTFGGTITAPATVYTATGTISSANSTPATFTGGISGTTLTVTNVTSGSIETDDYVVGGPANNTQVVSQTSGPTGGAGTYTVTPAQNYPDGPLLTAGTGGSTLQFTFTDPFLVGTAAQLAADQVSVTGTNVAPGTVITGYTGTNGLTATYTVSTFNLVGTEPLVLDGAIPGVGTISAAGTTPALLTGFIDGTTLTVSAAGGGTLNSNDYVVGGPTANTQIVSQLSGTPGGVGTYTVSPSQTWNLPTMTAGQGGTSLQLSVALLPSGVLPADLVGALVQGAGVASGTQIIDYLGTTGDTANFQVSTFNLVGDTLLTMSVGSTDIVTLTVPSDINPGSLIGQAIAGDGIAPGTVINGFVPDSTATPGSYTYTVNNPIASSTTTVSVTTPNLYETQTGLVVGLSDGSVQYWNGLGCGQTSSSGCTGAANPSGQAAYGGGWTQLQASNGAGWGEDNPINTLITLPNNLGIVVGLGNGSVQLWNSTIMLDGTILPGAGAPSGCGTNTPASCWIQLQGGGWDSAANAMISSGQNGGLIVGLADGSVQQWKPGTSPGAGSWTQLQGQGWDAAVNTMLPYDGTTFVGSIGGYPETANFEWASPIVVPSYATSDWVASSPELSAATAGCESSYFSGAGYGCGGNILTVQEVAGAPLRVGQTLYGGAGLAQGTTITAQISDGSGNLCATSCNAGGTGVYFVNNAQLVAPGTPMSASDGTAFVVGLSGGAVEQWTGSGWNQLQGNGWSSVVNAMIPWRDGLVAGLNNGSVFYWSPSNNPNGDNDSNPNALDYPGSTIPSNSQSSGWSQLQGTGWSNAVTSMLPLGDGFAVGLTATDSSQNGTVQYYTGFGPASTTQAFGYGPGASNPVPLTPTNTWTQIAGSGDLSGDSASGSIQLLIPLSVNTMDPSGSGTVVLSQSLIAGQTNNGIYAWTGSTLNTDPADIGSTGSAWQMIQASDAGTKPVLANSQLANAWNWVTTTSAPTFSSNTFGGTGAVGETWVPATQTGDPVFGLQTNQAPCSNNNTCSSAGDYYSFVFTYAPGADGVIYSWPPNESSGIQANVNLEMAGYGYIFVPNGTWDKFHPDQYAMGLLLAAQGGPSLDLTLPSVNFNETVNIPVYTKVEPIEGGLAGTVTLKTGVQIQAQAGAQITNDVPITLAGASFTPGILLTWNVAGYQDNLAMTGAFAEAFQLATWSQIIQDVSDPSASASLTVTPSLGINWGYTIPEEVPVVGGDGLVNLGMTYSNPVTLGATVPDLAVTDPQLQLQLTTSGILGFNAALLPGITSSLSWNDSITLYTYNDYLPTITV